MKPMEMVILILIVVGLFYFISQRTSINSMWSDKFNISPYFGRDIEGVVKCDDDLGSYYAAKYTDRHRYHPLSTDAMDYVALKQQQAAITHQDMWKRQMAKANDGAYVDDKGVMYKTVAESQAKPSNATLKSAPQRTTKTPTKAMPVPAKTAVPAKEKFTYYQMDNERGDSHESMANNRKKEDRNAPLSVSDLLPDPCLNNGKDWTNVFTECENLVGGQNFIRFEDEHFTNQVLDTRCTKYQSHDLRRTPAIQYSDVSIWNKPSVCKNIYEYIRPQLDS